MTVSDPEMVSIITEAMNIESYKTLYPTYYKQALQDKFSRDEESIEMIDLLISGRNFDFCTLFSSNIPGMPWMFRTLVAEIRTISPAPTRQARRRRSWSLTRYSKPMKRTRTIDYFMRGIKYMLRGI